MARIVLLADDSVTAQNMGRRILTDAGYEVITVNNGSAALKKVHENRPDLIVLDVYMPGYGGLEVCQRLKESGETMRIPVLLTVGKMEPFKSDEAKRVRADGHIVKPFEASELLAALTKLEDRIVPGTDGRGRKGKADKKSKSWQAGEEAPPAAGEWTDRVAYLAQAKQRVSSHENEAVEAEVASPPPAPKKPAPITPAPEMAVVADALTEVSEKTIGLPVDSNNKKADSEATPAAVEAQASAEAAATGPAVSEAGAKSAPQAEVAAATSGAPHEVQAETSEHTISTKARWIAENVALTAEEAALELEQEMQQAQTAAAPAVAGSEPTFPAKVADAKSPERKGAAFAAAASVSGVSGAGAPTPATSSEEENPPAGLDASAAWKNWEQIRDSVMSTHSTEAIAKSVADVAQTTQAPPEASAPDSAAVASTPQPIEGEALASIVDTVLAELKPKLMEQIAKKLASEKK